jgi:hypothetical protein
MTLDPPTSVRAASPPLRRERLVASLAYAVPLAVSWLLPQRDAAFAISLLFPLALAAAGFLTKRRPLLLHGGQAFHLLAAYALLAAFLGIVAKPGVLRWAGQFGSIPLDPDAIRAAKVAFWLVAISRSATLFYLGVVTLRGRDAVLPFLGCVPFFGRVPFTEPAR